MNNLNTTQKILLASAIILAIAGISLYFKRRSEVKETEIETVSYRLPTSPDTRTFGPAYWAAFHNLASRIPCGGCRGFAEKFVVFMHDTINKKLQKNLYDPENFSKFTAACAALADGVDFQTAFKDLI